MKIILQVTFPRNFQIFKSFLIFLFLLHWTVNNRFWLFCFQKSSVVFQRFWPVEFSGVARILIACKVLEKTGLKIFKISVNLSKMLHFMSLYAANVFKATSKDGEGCCYLRQIFPSITDVRIKEGIFVVLWSENGINDKQFVIVLVVPDKIAWKVLKAVMTQFSW